MRDQPIKRFGVAAARYGLAAARTLARMLGDLWWRGRRRPEPHAHR